jgi:Fe-S cluster assembly iron-binding protein IscA
MLLVTLGQGAGQAVKSLLSERGIEGPVRIEIESTGCCDTSLRLIVDTVRESDLVEELDGVTFVISPETYQLVGEVRISCADDPAREGLVLTSSKPISEWDGFAPRSIKM